MPYYIPVNINNDIHIPFWGKCSPPEFSYFQIWGNLGLFFFGGGITPSQAHMNRPLDNS
jgi:hypothetical protein